MNDNLKFIKENISVISMPGDFREFSGEVILYGIAGIIIPQSDNKAILAVGNDPDVSNNQNIAYVELRQGGPDGLYKLCELGLLSALNGQKLFIRGKWKDNNIVIPTHEIRIIME